LGHLPLQDGTIFHDDICGVREVPCLIHANPEADLSPRRLKVLFAEDEVLLRLMLCDFLRDNGFQVFEATGAAEAMSILSATPVDVVITDLHMRATGDGMELARHVRAHLPSASLLLAAATIPPLVEPSAFDAFFIKPYQPEHIVAWIRRHHPAIAHHEGSSPS
jgi:DNA-binding response OmpR family regulator